MFYVVFNKILHAQGVPNWCVFDCYEYFQIRKTDLNCPKLNFFKTLITENHLFRFFIIIYLINS